MKKKSKSKVTVERMRIGQFRATLGQVFAAGHPVILSNGGSVSSDPRAIVLTVAKFDDWDGGASQKKAFVKLREDLDAAIREIESRS